MDLDNTVFLSHTPDHFLWNHASVMLFLGTSAASIILVFLGLLSEKSEMKIRSGLTSGGPLGELVQWADVLSALTALGHQLTVVTKLR